MSTKWYNRPIVVNTTEGEYDKLQSEAEQYHQLADLIRSFFAKNTSVVEFIIENNITGDLRALLISLSSRVEVTDEREEQIEKELAEATT